jgi:pimeloyl-ACP methyl ester carboxylesterase
MSGAYRLATASVISRDGTIIAYEKSGVGSPLILVDAAGHYRRFSSFDRLIGLLVADFTVYQYDRRGRGDSGDTPPYAPEREVEDLAGLIEEAGGSAFLYGFSSGGLLAVQAAAYGLPIRKLGLLEPPIALKDDSEEQRAFTAGLSRLLTAGRRNEAVEYYLAGIGLPAEILDDMRGSDAWTAMKAVAPTLLYDCVISQATPYELLASVTTPTLVIDSEGSSDDLTGMAATVARGMPNASQRSLPGEWHGVRDDLLARTLIEFFTDLSQLP